MPVYDDLFLEINSGGEQILKPREDAKPSDSLIILDSIFMNAPKAIFKAVAKHEDTHIRYQNLADASEINSEEKNSDLKLAVNTIAFMESGNSFCMALPEIAKELREHYGEARK